MLKSIIKTIKIQVINFLNIMMSIILKKQSVEQESIKYSCKRLNLQRKRLKKSMIIKINKPRGNKLIKRQ